MEPPIVEPPIVEQPPIVDSPIVVAEAPNDDTQGSTEGGGRGGGTLGGPSLLIMCALALGRCRRINRLFPLSRHPKKSAITIR